jgi:hypothetical protein
VTAAVTALDQLAPSSLTWGLLHADPAPEHFRLDPSSSRCGLIDLRFRRAVQADYFARRIAEHDLTGITGPADNEKGLDDARRWLR